MFFVDFASLDVVELRNIRFEVAVEYSHGWKCVGDCAPDDGGHCDDFVDDVDDSL